MRAEIDRFASAEQPAADAKLAVAIEELRAQNEALQEACTRLERESAKYRHLYDSAPDALVTTDERGIIIDANPATGKLLGFRNDMMPGKLLIGFVARRDTMAFRDHLRAIVGSTGHGAFSVRMRPRGGTPFVAHLAVRAVFGTVRPVRGPREAPVAFHWTIGATTLESPRGVDVHDLLDAVHAELRAVSNDPQQKAFLDQLRVLMAIIRDDEPPRDVSVAEIALIVADRIRPAARSRGVEVEIERGAGEPRTHARIEHLAWALEHVLASAIEVTTSPGSVRVRIDTDDLGALLQVRADGASPLPGDGLTVAIARAAIERHGGSLRIPEVAEDGVVLGVRLPPPAPISRDPS